MAIVGSNTGGLPPSRDTEGKEWSAIVDGPALSEDARRPDPDRPAPRDVSTEPAPSVYLATDRLILRRLTENDVDNLFDLDSDPEVMRYLNNGVPHTRGEIVTRVLPHYLDHSTRFGERYGFWAAIERASGVFIGWFHFRPYRTAPDEIDLGYRLKRSVRGKGCATEGSRALIRKGFTEFGIGKVVADTLVGNVRSRRVMEVLGMHREEEFVLDEDEHPNWDSDQRRGVKYALTKAEWEGAR